MYTGESISIIYDHNLYSFTLGEEADRISGLASSQDSMSESVFQSREHISNLLER